MKYSHMILWVIFLLSVALYSNNAYKAQGPIEHWVTWDKAENQLFTSSQGKATLITLGNTSILPTAIVGDTAKSIRALASSPNGAFLALAQENEIVIYETKTSTPLITLETGNANILWLAWSPNGEYLAAISYEEVENLKLWHGENYQLLLNASLGQIFQASWSPDSQTIAYVNTSSQGFYTFLVKEALNEINLDGESLIHPLTKSVVYHSLPSNQTNDNDVSTAIAWSETNEWIVIGSYSGNIRLFDVKNNKFTDEFQGHNAPITAIDFNLDAQKFGTASQDGFIRLWGLENTLIMLAEYPKGEIFTRQIDFSPDGKALAFGIAPEIAESLNLMIDIQIVDVTNAIIEP